MELSVKCLCGIVGIIGVYLLYIYFVKSPLKKKKIINEGFEPSKTFKGARKNKVFKLGKKGLGYYLDKKKS
tara:strand:- start:37 stop:249 length:213 start_codon:yes stop_codon:yes gene_type:complete